MPGTMVLQRSTLMVNCTLQLDICAAFLGSQSSSPHNQGTTFSKKTLNAEGMSQCRGTPVSFNALRQSPAAFRGSPENQKNTENQQLHSHCLRLSRSTGIAGKQFISCKMKQFLTKEGKPEQLIFSFSLAVLLDFSPVYPIGLLEKLFSDFI